MPVMTEPGDERAAAAEGRGHMRASRADRDRVIEVLKAAFVQGRLDQGELDTRVGQTLASRTYAELAALTADIPAETAPRQPVRTPKRASQGHPIRTGFAVSGAGLVVAVAAILGALKLDDHASAALLELAAFIIAVVVPVVMMVAVGTAWEQRRSRKQLPPRPGRDGHTPDAGPHGVGRDLIPPAPRPDQTRADLRSDRSRPWWRTPGGHRYTTTPIVFPV
jgi:hypothetical protein